MQQYRYSIRTDLHVHRVLDHPSDVDRALIELVDQGRERLVVIRERERKVMGETRRHEDMAVDGATWLRVRGVLVTGDLPAERLEDEAMVQVVGGARDDGWVALERHDGSIYLRLVVEGDRGPVDVELTRDHVRALLPHLQHFAAFGVLTARPGTVGGDEETTS